MKRPFTYFSAALILLVLMLTFSLSLTTRTVKAVRTLDKCDRCVGKVQQRLEKCEAQSGGPTQACYDQYNQGIVDCYATVCEQ
jgi:hypothetical protein